MIIFKGYQFRLYPNETQKEQINKTIGSCRYCYNYFLNKKDEYYKKMKKNLSLKDMKHELVELKKEVLWLQEVDSMSLTQSLEDLDRAYINFFNKRGAHPVFKKKGNHEKYKTNCIKGSYKDREYANISIDLVKRKIKLPKIGEIEIRGYRKLKKELNIINATIFKESNRYYVSLCVKEEIMLPERKIKHAIGIDLGVTSLVTTSDGIKYPKLKVERMEKHIEVYQERLSKCVKGSKNYYKIKNKIARLYQRIRNMRKHYINDITNEIIKDNDLIVCETLKTKSMIENNKSKKLKRGIVNASFKKLISVLEYKTKWQNKLLIKINTYFPSSKICSHCGERNEINDLSIRSFECKKCHYTNDRDINASINILDEGIRLAIQNGLLAI